MSSLIWVVAIAAGLAIFWFLFKSLLGFSLPPETTGKAYLRKELKKMSIDQDAIPDECISELVDIAIKSANLEKMMGKHFNNSFAEGLDDMADTVRIWMHNPNDIAFRSEAGEENIYREIFERYNGPTN